MKTILPANGKNKRTGKCAVVVHESDTHYHVRLESGKYSRWVKANTDIYHGCLAPIEKQRDVEKESAALIVETMVEPLIEAVSTSFQKVQNS